MGTVVNSSCPKKKRTGFRERFLATGTKCCPKFDHHCLVFFLGPKCIPNPDHQFQFLFYDHSRVQWYLWAGFIELCDLPYAATTPCHPPTTSPP